MKRFMLTRIALFLFIIVFSTPLSADFIVTEKGDIGDLRWWNEQTVMSENSLFVFGHMKNIPGDIVYKLYTIDTETDAQSDIILTWEDASPVQIPLNATGFFDNNTILVHWREADYYSAGNSAEVTGILNISSGVVTKWQANPVPLIDAVPDEKYGVITDIQTFYANGSYIYTGNTLFKQGIDKDTTTRLYRFNTLTKVTDAIIPTGVYSFITGFDISENRIYVLWTESGTCKYGKMAVDGSVETAGDFPALKTYRRACQNDAVIIISGLDFSDQKKLYEYNTITGTTISSPFVDQSRNHDVYAVNNAGEVITLWWDAAAGTEKYGIITSNASITLTGDIIVPEDVGSITITATLANASSETVTVEFALNEDGNDTATFLADYTTLAESFIEIPSGALSGTIDIAIENDTFYESGEGEIFTVSISAVINGTETGDQRVSVKITEEDNDGDNLPDDWESDHNAHDPDGDEDNDGILNSEEFENNSDPHKVDSDNDGLSDSEEINIIGSDPSKADTDDDGYSDRAEVLHGTDPVIAETEPPEALIIYVNETAEGSGSGLSWPDAFTELYNALDLSPWLLAGDQIWVAAGTYYPDTKGLTDPREATFSLINGIGIYGGFMGFEYTPEDRVPIFNVTVLSGDIGIEGDITDNSYHVFYHSAGSALDETALIDGFVISDGNANGSGLNSIGGGMFNNTCSPTLSQIAFTNNAADYGGGLFNKDSAPVLSRCVFKENRAVKSGGGIHTAGSTLTIDNSIFEGNHSNISGGALTLIDAAAVIRNSLFYHNTCNHSGAVLNVDASDITITGSTFTQNNALLNNGCLHALFSTTDISSSILWQNNPEEIMKIESDVSITYSIVSGGYDGEGNADEDPVFADPDNDDFSLSVNSPCPGGGDPAATEETHGFTDLSGNFRVACLTMDMGAFELQEPMCNGQAASSGQKSSGGGGCFIKTALFAEKSSVSLKVTGCIRALYNRITEE